MDDLISRDDVYNVLTKVSISGMPIYVFDKLWNGVRDLPSVEPERKKGRPVKVEDKYHDYLPYSRFMESTLKGNCGFCGETVWLGEKYCHECGTKLDWSGDE